MEAVGKEAGLAFERVRVPIILGLAIFVLIIFRPLAFKKRT